MSRREGVGNPAICQLRDLVLILYAYEDGTYDFMATWIEQSNAGWYALNIKDSPARPLATLQDAMSGRDKGTPPNAPLFEQMKAGNKHGLFVEFDIDSSAAPSALFGPSFTDLGVTVRTYAGSLFSARIKATYTWQLKAASTAEERTLLVDSRAVYEAEKQFRIFAVQQGLSDLQEKIGLHSSLSRLGASGGRGGLGGLGMLGELGGLGGLGGLAGLAGLGGLAGLEVLSRPNRIFTTSVKVSGAKSPHASSASSTAGPTSSSGSQAHGVLAEIMKAFQESLDD